MNSCFRRPRRFAYLIGVRVLVCVRGGIFVCVGLPGFTVAVLVAEGNRVAATVRVAVFRGGVIFDFVAEGLMNLVGVLDASTSLVGVRVLVNVLGFALGVLFAVGVRVDVCVEIRWVGVTVGSWTVYSTIFARALAFIEMMLTTLGQ